VSASGQLTAVPPPVERPAPARARAGSRRPWPARHALGRRALTLASGVAAGIPVIVATAKAVGEGWVPAADQGIIATRSWDVLTGHAPLVGQYSYAGHVIGHTTYSLGPMLYWLLALPAHYGSPAAITWTMAAVNVLSIVGAVALARRRGGLPLMFATALAMALMSQSWAAEMLHDIWNPSAGLFPFTLLLFLCWSLACGEYRLLPLTALVASYVLQANLMYLAPTLALLAIAAGGLLLSWRAARRAGLEQVPVGVGSAGPAPPAKRLRAVLRPRAFRRAPAQPASEPGPATRRRARVRVLAWLGAAVVVAGLCWSTAVVQQLQGSPGNVTLVLRSATTHKTTMGASVGWHAVVRAVGVRPWWLYVPVDRWQRQYDVQRTPPSHATVSCVLLLLALLGAGAVAVVRRRRDVASAALIGLALCGALAAVAASTPRGPGLTLTLGYTMWWGTQVGMWVWLTLAWCAWLAAGWARTRWRTSASASSRPPRIAGSLPSWASRALPLAGGLAAVAAIAAVGAAVADTGKPDEHRSVYRPSASLARSLERTIGPGHSVNLITNLGYSTMVIKPALRYLLTRHGIRPLGRGSRARIGDWYELGDRPFQYFVYVKDGVRSPAGGARLVDRVSVVDGKGTHVVTAWVAPHPRARAAKTRPSAARRV
jgi:hypothetical protein